jgi:hypothetical protein
VMPAGLPRRPPSRAPQADVALSREQAQAAYRGVVPQPFLLFAPHAEASSCCWLPLPWRTARSPSWASPSPSEHTTALPRPHMSLPAPLHTASFFHLAGTGAQAA